MTASERWLAALWPVVRRALPDPPARVVEIGCGPLGGFVPMLSASGYAAVGVDPEAPRGEEYRRVEFERAQPFTGMDAVVASTSLHHVADPEDVVQRIVATLVPEGTVVVVEWNWEAFDEPTAQWCAHRLGPDDDPGWLHRRRDEWEASGQPWSTYLRDWVGRERIHPVEMLLRLLDEHFERVYLAAGPYFFPDLAETTDEDEQAAIEAGEIQANRVDYVGRLR